MAIKIQTQQTFIPIFLGDEEIRFHLTDDSLVNLKKEAEKVQKELDEIEKSEDEEEVLEQMREILNRGFDLLYGKGTFNKVYKITPSVTVCLNYFQQMNEAVFKELDKRGISVSQKEKAKQYLAKKNKKK